MVTLAAANEGEYPTGATSKAVGERSREVALLRTFLALLSVTVAVLAYEVRALKPQADTLMRNRALPYAGQLVPTARALTLTGDTVILGETAKGRSQVLFFLSASCQYCLQTLPTWKGNPPVKEWSSKVEFSRNLSRGGFHEEVTIYGQPDHGGVEGSGGGGVGAGALPDALH